MNEARLVESGAGRGAGGARSRTVVHSFTGGAFAQNTILVECSDGRTGLLVDPGAATAEALHAASARGLDIAAILLTHAHLDHVEKVGLARESTGAPIHLHPADRPLYDGVWAQATAFGVSCGRLPEPDVELVPGRTLTFGGTSLDVLFAPGHAPGHVILHCPADSLAIVGDVVFQGSIGRTDLPGGDFDTLMDSIRRVVLRLPPETVLHPGHGPETTVAMERDTNPFLVPGIGGALA